MTKLPLRERRLQKFVADIERTRTRRDEALTRLVRFETQLKDLERRHVRMLKAKPKPAKTKPVVRAIAAKLNELPPPAPAVAAPGPKRRAKTEQPAPPKAEPAPTPPAPDLAKAARMREELRGERKPRGGRG
jgi:hypothetical protein